MIMLAVLSFIVILGGVTNAVPQGGSLVPVLTDSSLPLSITSHNLTPQEQDDAVQAGIEVFLAFSKLTKSYNPKYLDDAKNILTGVQALMTEMEDPVRVFGAEVKGNLDNSFVLLSSLLKLSRSIQGPSQAFIKTTVNLALDVLQNVLENGSSLPNKEYIPGSSIETIKNIVEKYSSYVE